MPDVLALPGNSDSIFKGILGKQEKLIQSFQYLCNTKKIKL